jgi:hypothetical protein
MHRLLLNILVAFLTFLIGVSASMVWIAYTLPELRQPYRHIIAISCEEGRAPTWHVVPEK